MDLTGDLKFIYRSSQHETRIKNPFPPIHQVKWLSPFSLSLRLSSLFAAGRGFDYLDYREISGKRWIHNVNDCIGVVFFYYSSSILSTVENINFVSG
jgi:hypothetical protein